MGLPNVGKSSLLNALLKEEIAITSAKAQTTRNAILGIVHEAGNELIFIDTPGIHKAKTELGNNMNKEAFGQAEGADVIYYMIDAKRGLSYEDHDVLKRLFKLEIPIFLVINKIDLIAQDLLAKLLTDSAKEYAFAEYVPISVLNDDNLQELVRTTVTYFKDDVKYYPDDMKTNVTQEFRIKEIIRRQVLLNCNEEIPHLVAVAIDTLKITDKSVKIEAVIICNKDSHKAIIIGHKGQKLKVINNGAVKELKELFQKKIYLSLFVKVKQDWMNKTKDLLELGYGRYE